MRHRCLAFVGALALIVAGAMMATVPVTGQAAGAGKKGGSAPRTAWGDPDLQGTWSTTTSVPFERPARYAGRALMTDEELAKAQEQARQEAAKTAEPLARPGDTGTYNRFWTDRGMPTRQTSQVVDPPDGKLPPLTPAGREAVVTRVRGTDSWEARHIWERCVTRGGMPNVMLPRVYNNNVQILQTPGSVVMLLEQIHEVRVIPTDGRPHLPAGVRQWLGDSRGRWDGESLVVDTTQLVEQASGLQPWSNFSAISGSGVGMHITERLTRVGAEEIAYRLTVDDPQMYTKPWTVEFPMRKTEELIYEYACHEGNYGMEGILKGARADEKAGRKANKETDKE